MTYLLVTQDEELQEAFCSPEAFLPTDNLLVEGSWEKALACKKEVDLMFVDILATLENPHEIAGYEKFARAKMSDERINAIPLILIGLPAGYDIDFMVGFPDFLFAQVPPPVTAKIFRRASTWI